MHMSRMTRAVLLMWGVAITVSTSAGDTVPTDWPALQSLCEEAGLDATPVREIFRHCQRERIGIGDAHAMLGWAIEASREELPARPVMAKIVEGLGKGVPPEDIAEVSRQRVRHLYRAREIIRAADGRLAVEPVIVAGAQAMESGVSEDAVRVVVEAGRDSRAGDLQALLEAGEELYLAGFGSEDIPPMLIDCLQRRLNRVELRRAVRYACQQRQRGMEPRRIRQALWGGEQGSQQQHQNREHNGQGGGIGPGPGGPRHGRGRP
ncbi:hypothetical protein JXA88_06255 [Candidatus Fermentibacteria bacterium]|nr:hypothetical protein [Candidatus Fermentibacteria bacterium]